MYIEENNAGDEEIVTWKQNGDYLGEKGNQ